MRKLSVTLWLLAAGLVSQQSVAAEPGKEAVNARYETTQCAHPCSENKHFQWWLMREPGQVEIRHLYKSGEPAHHSGLWMQKPANQMAYAYLMHEDQRAIDYMDVDLKLLGMKTDVASWQVKSQLVTDDELAKLLKHPQSEVNRFGYKVEHYTGKQADGTQVDIVWMPALKLPEAIHYGYAKHDVTIQLQVLQFDTQASTAERAPKTGSNKLAHYQHVDFTDIGDMEHNADDVKWLARAHGAPGIDQPHAH